MIREIVNFTKNLLDDFPDIIQWNVKPNGGLYVFIHLDEEGHCRMDNLIYGKDFFYLNSTNTDAIGCVEKAKCYEEQVQRVGTSMNKVLDKKKQIFSCSPFALTFKKKSLTNDSLNGDGVNKIRNLLPDYFNTARLLCSNMKTEYEQSIRFEMACNQLLDLLNIFQQPFCDGKINILANMKGDEYINLFLENVPLEIYTKVHNIYLKEKLFNSSDFNVEISGVTYGLSGFMNGLNSKKIFLSHKTGLMLSGINGRITSEDASYLNMFGTLILNGTLPNPLPIVIDKKEINGKIVAIFNKEGKKSYREILRALFENGYIENLPDYYLLNYSKGQKNSFLINDIDFVPFFRYYLGNGVKIKNLFQVGNKKNGEEFVCEPDSQLLNIFDLERIVLKEIFNNALVVDSKKGIKLRYFVDIDPSYVKGGDLMCQLILKYRQAFYDYIYKSRQNALNVVMFDEIMFISILSDIHSDKVQGSFSNSYSIKKKLNIWFSLIYLFNNTNNNINLEIMTSKITDLLYKMRDVAKGVSVIETPEEFAFAAGQLVSFLIDRSVASNKTYSMLEPYLQKSKSGQLQDAIANTVSIYKHDISIYKGAFQRLASNVLTCDDNLDMKPLLKFFLAGCFSQCVIYIKSEND